MSRTNKQITIDSGEVPIITQEGVNSKENNNATKKDFREEVPLSRQGDGPNRVMDGHNQRRNQKFMYQII